MPGQLKRPLTEVAVAVRLGFVAALLFATSTVCAAAELSGILIYTCAPTDDPNECAANSDSPAWHTTVDDIAAPIVVLPGLLPGNAFKIPLNGSGELRFPLAPGKTLLTLLWQPPPKFTPRLGVNFYFNGDQLTPGAAAIVPTWTGPALTRFWPNLSPTIPSLYLRDADSPGAVTYSDGNSLVEITALLIGLPNVVGTIDRAGRTALHADGAIDAVAILELTVSPVLWRREPSAAPAPLAPAPAPGAIESTALIGVTPATEDTVVSTPDTDTTPTQSVRPSTPARTASSAAPVDTTPTPKRSGTPETPTAAADQTPGPPP